MGARFPVFDLEITGVGLVTTLTSQFLIGPPIIHFCFNPMHLFQCTAFFIMTYGVI